MGLLAGVGHRRARRAVSFETLEGRALLSGATVHVSPSAEIHALAIANATRPTIVVHGHVTGSIGAVKSLSRNENG